MVISVSTASSIEKRINPLAFKAGLLVSPRDVYKRQSYDKMRYTGKFQIESSEEEQIVCSVSLPALFAAFPNDIVSLQMTQVGITGEFRVSETTTWADGSSAGTEIKMIRK